MIDNNKKLQKRLALEKPEARPLVKTIIGITSVSSAALLGMAAPALLDASTTYDYIKIAFLAGGAAVVTYGVNTIAVERIAPLWAVGSKIAGVAGALAIATVGIGLSTSTYSGLVRPELSELRLQEFGRELTEYTDTSYERILAAGRVIPVIRANVNDREQKLACEVESSCLSEHKSGGDGPVARFLRGQVERANEIAGALEKSKGELAAALRDTNRKLAQYRKTLADSNKSLEERRTELQQIAAEILQSISELKETAPQGLLRAYLAEIEAGITLAGKPVATRNINALQRKYAGNLRTILDQDGEKELVKPTFPTETGVAETLERRWLFHFLPIALFVGVLELVWPLLIFLITYQVLSYNVKRSDPPAPRPAKPGPFDILIEKTPADTDEAETDTHNATRKPQRYRNTANRYADRNGR